MITGIHETVLYAPDVPAAAEFYRSVLGLELVRPAAAQSAVLRIGADSVLILFDPAYSVLTGRGAPPHGMTGQGHVAFRIEPGSIGRWRDRLERATGRHVEAEVTWELGGRSLYVRDPAGNSVELVDGAVWPLAAR